MKMVSLSQIKRKKNLIVLMSLLVRSFEFQFITLDTGYAFVVPDPRKQFKRRQIQVSFLNCAKLYINIDISCDWINGTF